MRIKCAQTRENKGTSPYFLLAQTFSRITMKIERNKIIEKKLKLPSMHEAKSQVVPSPSGYATTNMASGLHHVAT